MGGAGGEIHGLKRGTDDKASAITIAEYCMRFRDRARIWKPVDTRLSKLKNMIVQRDRIVNALTQLIVPIEEMKSCDALKEVAELERLQLPAIKGLTKAKKYIEASIQSFSGKETIHKNIQLMCSIKGVDGMPPKINRGMNKKTHPSIGLRSASATPSLHYAQ